jgi:tripartite motif-containing protein 71
MTVGRRFSPLRRGGAVATAVAALLAALAPATSAHAADATAPDTTLTTPTRGAIVPAPVRISGGATDDVGVTGVEIAIQDSTTKQWWGGAGWVGKLAWNDATVGTPSATSTGWSYGFAATNGSGNYFATARALDAAGNVDTDRPTVTFSVGAGEAPTYVRDLVGPAFADLTPVDVASTSTRHYVIDVARYRIVGVDRSTGAVVAAVGGSRGTGDTGDIAAARAIAVDAAGSVYVADTPNGRITKYDANLASPVHFGSRGTGPGQFTQVYGLAIGTGRGLGGGLTEIVYTVDGDGRISRFTTSGSYIGSFAPGAALNQPRMAEVNPATNELWVVNARARQVVVFNDAGTEVNRFGGAGGGPGQFSGDPRGIAISDDGSRVYVSDEGNHRVQVFDRSGTYLSSIRSPVGTDAHLVDSRGLDVAPGGVLVVADEWAHALKEWTVTGAFQRKLFGNAAPVGGVNAPRGLAVDGSGRVYVSDWWNQRIQRFDADGSNPLAWGFRGTRKEPGSINFAWDVAVQPGTGRVFVANRENHEIEVFSASGAYVARWGIRGTANGRFVFPHGVAFDPRDGTLLVTDSGNGRIQRFAVDTAGNGTFLAAYGGKGTAAGAFNTPTGIDVAADGTIWVADTRNKRIQKRHPSTGAWTAYTAPVGGDTFSNAWGVSVAPDGSIWVADSGKGRIVKTDADMNPVFAATGPSLGAGKLNFPYEIEFGASGQVYVSDTFNNRVVLLQE